MGTKQFYSRIYRIQYQNQNYESIRLRYHSNCVQKNKKDRIRINHNYKDKVCRIMFYIYLGNIIVRLNYATERTYHPFCNYTRYHFLHTNIDRSYTSHLFFSYLLDHENIGIVCDCELFYRGIAEFKNFLILNALSEVHYKYQGWEFRSVSIVGWNQFLHYCSCSSFVDLNCNRSCNYYLC
jgi:hypothetical protein